MNDPSAIPPTDEETPARQARRPAPLTQIENLIRRHPVAAALTTVGFGCAVGIVARDLLAPPPKHRALQLLEEIQDHLLKIAEPAYDRASDLADEGLSSMKQGLKSASCSRLGKRLSHLFS